MNYGTKFITSRVPCVEGAGTNIIFGSVNASFPAKGV